MPTILSFVAVSGGSPTRASLEVLTRCREIGVAQGWDVEAVVLAADLAGAAEAAGRHGASRVHVVSDAVFGQHLNVPVLDALAQVIEQVQPRVVAFPSSEGVKDVLGALSARLAAPALADVSHFEITSDGVEATRPVMAAKFLARVSAPGSWSGAGSGEPVLVSVRSGSYAAEEAPAGGEAAAVDFSFDDSRLAQTLRDVAQAASGAVDLNEARVVVSAGRGVRDEEGKRLVEELAEVTGAAIGASRAVVESGMFPATTQIGQTGKVVSPELYFAVGLSGAIQHTAGMSNSRVIVAINKDADAPIFQMATFGLVGDLYAILPALIEEIRKAKG
jgi:electron transfer flavoprotein alpha subunit